MFKSTTNTATSTTSTSISAAATSTSATATAATTTITAAATAAAAKAAVTPAPTKSFALHCRRCLHLLWKRVKEQRMGGDKVMYLYLTGKMIIVIVVI